MSNYNPDTWVIIEIVNPDDKVKTTEKLYKLFGGWYGGYANGDSWRMNSGITKVVKDGEYIHFHGYSGSVYTCHMDSYGMSGYMSAVYMDMVDKTLDLEKITFRSLTEEEAKEYINES